MVCDIAVQKHDSYMVCDSAIQKHDMWCVMMLQSRSMIAIWRVMVQSISSV